MVVATKSYLTTTKAFREKEITNPSFIYSTY